MNPAPIIQEAMPLAKAALSRATPALEKLLTEVRELYRSFGATQSGQALIGERPVIVNSLSMRDNPVTLAPNSVKNGRGMEVRVNGDRAGKFDAYGDIKESEFPLNIRTANVSLSNGVEFSLAERKMKVISGWNYLGSGMSSPVKSTVFSNQSVNQSTVSGWSRFEKSFPEKTLSDPFQTANPRLKWDHIKDMRAGDPVSFEYPFQWADKTKLTNGFVNLPRVRPEGQEWRSLPLSATSKHGWGQFLEAMEGKYLHELLPTHSRIINPETTARALTTRQEAVQTYLQSKMWNGAEGVERVSTNGNAVIFKAPRGVADNVYVVDNPGVGALYLFKSYEQATKLAVGQSTRTGLRQEGAPFVVHSGDWKTKLLKSISEL